MSIGPKTASPAFLNLSVSPGAWKTPGSLTISPGVISPSSSAAVAGDQLEHRPGRVGALDRAVGERRVVLARDQRLVLPLGDRPGEDLRVEAGGRPHRQHLAVVGRPWRRMRPGSPNEPSAPSPTACRSASIVRRTLSPARAGSPASWPLGRPERVHRGTGRPRLAAQEAVVLVLDAGLADGVALLEGRVARQLQLLLGHLADVAEQVRPDRALPVLAREHALDRHPREAVLVLAQEEDLAGARARARGSPGWPAPSLRTSIDLPLDLGGGHAGDARRGPA